jgi:hypothetical protein
VLVPRYKLSLCHTAIKPDLLGFPGIGVFACGWRDHVITRFASDYCRKTGQLRILHQNPNLIVFSLPESYQNSICPIQDKVKWWNLVWHKHAIPRF